MTIKKIFSIFFLLFNLLSLPEVSMCQSHKIDSLKTVIQFAKTPAVQLTGYLQLCKEKNSLHGDSLLQYSAQIKKLALQLKDENALAYADYNFASHLLSTGKTDSVLQELNINSKKIAALTNRYLYYKYQLLKANVLNRKNRLNESLNFQLQLLNEAEKDNDISTQAFIYNYLGNTFLALNKPLDSKAYFFKGLEIIEKDGAAKHTEIEAYILSNIGLYYFNSITSMLKQTALDSAVFYFNKAIDISKQKEYLGVLASVLVLKGNVFSFQNKFSEAEKLFTEGISIRNKIGDPFYQINDLINLASFYTQFKQYQKAIATIDEGLYLSDKNKIEEERLQLLGIKASNYKLLNNYENYSKTLEAYIAVSNSNNKVNATKQLAEIQTKYDVQKKETLIAKQQLSLFQRKLLLYGGIFLAVIIAFILAYRFKKYQQQQKIKMALLLQQEKKQNETAVKDAEEKERKRIAAELHDNLGVQANAILHNSSLLTETNTENKIVLTDLQDTAKEMLHNLRETLWAMKTADVTATDLWLRIINFMKQMGRHYTAINFKVEGEAPGNYIIPSSKALNIVLILQEAVNNAVKHAASNKIMATSKLADKNWSIAITDNGKGFDLHAAKIHNGDNYGLYNIQERATTSAIALSITSQAGTGTTVMLTV